MFVEVFSEEGSKVTFYTIRKEGAEFSETEIFFRKVYESDYKEDVQKLAHLLSNQIANKYGAHEKYFNRHERLATALPPKKYNPFKKEKAISFAHSPLRLYTLKVSESVVVLFNGGLKFTKGSAQEDSNVSIHFHEANECSRKILEAIKEGMICLSHKTMVDFQGNKTIII
ncbi:hypothetical protein [Flavivirga eckloniae]|uniref:Uncharacterized protein n=1 Tax=Flavivirga eckloniae TaxID=1803846 RepID=A0A2K9PPZ6_9FLAO|nr:hypothetical protein [Flavivirga eckloniae]AUP79132.1 hypothetical protein C1H87_10640 [Flavivirga eckloniae]